MKWYKIIATSSKGEVLQESGYNRLGELMKIRKRIALYKGRDWIIQVETTAPDNTKTYQNVVR